MDPEYQELKNAARLLAIGCLAVLQAADGEIELDEAARIAADALQTTQHLLGPTAIEVARADVREWFGIDV